MTGGEKLLVVGVVGIGALAFLKFRQSTVSPPVTGPDKLTSTYDDLGAGAGPLAPLWKIAKPLQPIVSGAVQTLNKAVGGVNPYAGLTRNPDGTYTDGFGCKITFTPDGVQHRDCGGIGAQWDRSNVKKAAVGVYNAGKSAVNTVESWFS